MGFKFMKDLRTICVLCVLLLLTAGFGYSQAVNATLLGTVTDCSGAIVPNAKVTVTEVNTGVSRTGQTNESGNYTFPDLAPGQYSVTVESSGFKKETRKDITLTVNSSTRIDVQLTPGNVTETVEVTGAPPLLQTDRADTGAQMEVVHTASLPLGTQRNYQSLLNLVPGTTRASFQHSQFFNAASSLQTEVNGQMRMGNSYQIEGIDNNERTGLLQIMVPPLEAIQAVDVSTSNYEASLGRASGANTNVILKSGTNEFHGAGYEFLRNSALNARNFFDASVGHLAYNYFGGNIGGPIKKNKIFFFGDFLRVTDHEANTNLGTIPPSSWRDGNLSSGLTLAAPVVVYDPATGNPDGTNRTPFAGNIIPANRISPIAAKILEPGAGSEPDLERIRPEQQLLRAASLHQGHQFVRREGGRHRLRQGPAERALQLRPPGDLPGADLRPGRRLRAGRIPGHQHSEDVQHGRQLQPHFLADVDQRVPCGRGALSQRRVEQTDYGTTASKDIGIPGVNIDQWTSGLASINVNGGFSTPLVGYSASFRGIARKPTSAWSIAGPRRWATTPSSGAWTIAACATICCRRRPSIRAARSTSIRRRPR